SNLDVVAWRAKTLEQQEKVLVFNKRQHSPHSFFDPIEKPKNGRLVLENGRFYIFVTREAVCVPPEFACEMAAVDHRRGEFRSHYAGFIDPGWGWKDGKPEGVALVLEVRPFGRNEIITEGAPVCRISYERMREVPRVLYGKTGSHYVSQRGRGQPVPDVHLGQADFIEIHRLFFRMLYNREACQKTQDTLSLLRALMAAANLRFCRSWKGG
ncbi:MAG: hypothetical protein UY75_C0039G0001, partial [Parcubacteria group bacterium GW2011_GWC2_52_8c]